MVLLHGKHSYALTQEEQRDLKQTSQCVVVMGMGFSRNPLSPLQKQQYHMEGLGGGITRALSE